MSLKCGLFSFQSGECVDHLEIVRTNFASVELSAQISVHEDPGLSLTSIIPQPLQP